MSKQLLLKVRGIAKSFGKQQVLRDVNFELHSGMIAGIEGENGSGKSTLLKIIIGLLKPDAGSVMMKGNPGYCPQEPTVFDSLTVDENFRYFATAYGLTSSENTNWQEEKEKQLEWFNYKKYERMPVSKVSGGTRQKLNLSIALLHNPDLLILDEPYTGFDWETYLHFWKLTDELRRQGKAILIISHFVYDQSRFEKLYNLENGILKLRIKD